MLVGDIKIDKVKAMIIFLLIMCLGVIFNGMIKANEFCGGENKNSLMIMMQYQSMNPLSAEVFKLQCRELNRGY